MTIQAIFHGERNIVNAEKKNFELLNFEEVIDLQSGSHIYFVTKFGTVARAKIHGKVILKKRRPGYCEVPLKYGLFDYFHAVYENGSPKQEQLVRQVF